MAKEFKIGKHLFKEIKRGKKHFVTYDEGEIPIPAKLTKGNVDKIAEYIRRMFRKKKKQKKKAPEIMKANKLIKPIRRRQPIQVEVKQDKKEEVKHLGFPKIPNEYTINIEGIPKKFHHYHHGQPPPNLPIAKKEEKKEKEGKASDKPKYVQEEPVMTGKKRGMYGIAGKIQPSKPLPGKPSTVKIEKGVIQPREPTKDEILKMQQQGYIYDLVNKRFYKPEQPKEAKAGPKKEAVAAAAARVEEERELQRSEVQEALEAERDRLEQEAEDAAEEAEEKERAERRRRQREAEEEENQRLDFTNYVAAYYDGREAADHDVEYDLDRLERGLSQNVAALQPIAAEAKEPGISLELEAIEHEARQLAERLKDAAERQEPRLPTPGSLAQQMQAGRPLPQEYQSYANRTPPWGSTLELPPTGRGIPEVKPLSLSEIQKMMQKVPGYLGTVMSDELEKLPWSDSHDCCCIFNKSKLSDNDNGTHWESILLSPTKSKSLEIYDSLAMPIQGHVIKQMEDVIKKLNLPYELKLKINGKRDQMIFKDGNSTNSCGFFAMDFLNKRNKGQSFSEASGYGNPTAAEKALIPIEKRFKYLSLRGKL